jgi:hypothetical protein
MNRCAKITAVFFLCQGCEFISGLRSLSAKNEQLHESNAQLIPEGQQSEPEKRDEKSLTDIASQPVSNEVGKASVNAQRAGMKTCTCECLDAQGAHLCNPGKIPDDMPIHPGNCDDNFSIAAVYIDCSHMAEQLTNRRCKGILVTDELEESEGTLSNCHD